MIPVKPISETWTDAQWQAIWERDSELLVSAAAGSGKTAVLIRRLIEKITDKTNPINVDELLVVTFTNAAAAEMRHRLSEAVEAAIMEDPDSRHLRQQLHLLNKAQISTLHSFCLQIIRQHGYLLDIDPGFRLASENEAVMLQEDALEEIIEEAYEQDQEAMYYLADSFSSDRSDHTLETLILNLYHYARVHPHPEAWLGQLVDNYRLSDETTVDDLELTREVKQAILYKVQTAQAENALYMDLAKHSEGLEKLQETATVDAELLHQLEHVALYGTWAELYESFGRLKWATAKSVRGDYDEEAKEQATTIRNHYKKEMAELKDYYFARTPARLLEEIQMMYPTIATLIRRVNEFSHRYEEKKAARSVLDFSDLEHRAYQLLTQQIEQVSYPSEVAKAYQRKFHEVLVDEYQDINLLQESIIQLVKKPAGETGNLFMVGDVKQSIYRFRLAEPMLFLSKYAMFKKDESLGKAIDLNANFRSRREVLEGINFVFAQTMGEDVGEIAYDSDAALKKGAPYSSDSRPIEVHIFSKDTAEEGTEEVSKARVEAVWTAKKIRELVDGSHPVTNPWKGESRPAEFSDMVILLRSMTWTPEFLDVFKEYKIPIYVETKTGFYDSLEIMWMLDLLKVIDNPYQDIPLAAVLRSPMFGLSDEELAKIRMSGRKLPLYEVVQNRESLEQVSGETQDKLKRFLVLHRAWNGRSQSGPLSELIAQLLQDTFLFEQVAAMPGGAQRQSNLRLLLDQAEQFEQSSYRGVFRFLRFVERIKKRGDDVGEARAISERENVVRIMTIHASKGLEFPFVFLPGMARPFNLMDFKGNYLFDQDYGLAVKAIDPELRIAYQSLPYMAMKEKKQLQTKAEEMRILYVAMTRAREKLFLTLSIPSLDLAVQKWMTTGYRQPDEPVPPFLRSNAMSYWDWLGPAFMRLPEFQQIAGVRSRHTKLNPEVWSFSVHAPEEEMKELPSIFDKVGQGKEVSSLPKVIEEQFNRHYLYELATKKTAKQTVTELKRLQQLESSDEDFFSTKTHQPMLDVEWEEPVFLQGEAIATAVQVGTAYHSVFQHLPLDQEVSSAALLGRLVEREILTKEEAAAIRPDAIERFYASALMDELRNAKQIYREQPFTYSTVDEEGNRQLIQGVIDLFFEDHGGQWHLIDFKTDRLFELRHDENLIKEELTNRYQLQLTIYGKALEDILKLKLQSKRIYSVPYDCVVTI
ncbi:helicase-exonuclease AddAB subunit AddA [Chryseomicrobium palamuruense]|uniref:ATP-dependent helicase/nuclease subunit A n=1 Tax=Chryseomicrobium palamuruense TaxID=682973 RepID=A0ABV8US10_9BACL